MQVGQGQQLLELGLEGRPERRQLTLEGLADALQRVLLGLGSGPAVIGFRKVQG